MHQPEQALLLSLDELQSRPSQAEVIEARSSRAAIAFGDRYHHARRERLIAAVETLTPEVCLALEFDAPVAQEPATRLLGYVRVSTADQDASLQRNALMELRQRPTEIIEDVISGSRADRPGLDKLLSMLRPGDTVAVWKLDRLGRSLRQLIDTAEIIRAKGATLHSITENLDTSTAGGRVLFHVLGALAEFERDTIRERVTAGMKAAKEAGRHTGRPARMNSARAAEARRMLADGKSWNQVCRVLEISQATLSRALHRYPETYQA